jgi:hypothetical protein
VETDEEFQKRLDFWENKKKESKEKRYEEYLKLKKEFKPEEKHPENISLGTNEDDNYSGVMSAHYHKKFKEEGIE